MFAIDCDEVKGVVVEEGVRATCAVRVLGGSALLVGTDRGTVIAFVQDRRDGAAGELVAVCQQALHHGPVYHLAVGASHLVCSTGHDARCCVLPLFALFPSPPSGVDDDAETNLRSRGVDEYRWIEAHSLPVVRACFLADGYTVASLDISGVLALSRLNEKGAVLQERIACGFPARALAVSRDETCCFVGGAGLVRVDLQQPYRPLDAFNTATSTATHSHSSRRSHVAVTPMTRLGGSGEEVPAPPPGTLVSRLTVSHVDGSVRAEFVRRPSDGESAQDAVVVSAAEWSIDNPKWSVARVFSELPRTATPTSASPRLRLRHHTHASRTGIVCCRQRWPSVATSRLVLQPNALNVLGGEGPSGRKGDGESWASPLLQKPYAAVHTLVSPLASSGSTVRVAAPTTAAEQLAQEQERNKKLQEQCNELAQALKVLVEQKRKNKKAKSRA